MQSVDQAIVTSREHTGAARTWRPWWIVLAVVGGALLFALVFYRLSEWPVTWFDEGSHLHVPKTLVTEGVYADRSSEGYRYFGPTVGVGPTVMLPVALAFQVAGIGLLQARVVMALYLLAAIGAYFLLARRFGAVRFALIATVLFATMRGASTIEYGREVLGEVPALFFLASALAIWFGGENRPSVARLVLAGLLLGLAAVTKSQFLLVIAPALLLAWVANLLYYRAESLRYFVITGVAAAAVVAAWQAYQVVYLGPSTWQENFAMLRAASAGAAFVFSSDLMRGAMRELLSLKIFLGLLPLFVGYGVLKALPRSRQGMRWGVVMALTVCNLAWFVIASIGWLRYAYLGLALSALGGAALFDDLFAAVRWEWRAWARSLWQGQPLATPVMAALLAAAGLIALVAAPLALTARDIVRSPAGGSSAMAAEMNRRVPQDALVETWEPEMGFLTNHTYHYPPSGLLDKAVGYKWRGGPSPAGDYSFVEEETPPFLLIGVFSRWNSLYDSALEGGRYRLVATHGAYDLFESVSPAESSASEP